MTDTAWSYSRLTSYETCPRKYWNYSVEKSITEVKNETTIYGDEVHKAFAARIKSKTPLPLHLRHYESAVAQFAAAPGEKIVEQKLALSKSFEVVEWFARDAWLRVISDLTVLNGPHGVIIDHKTGRPYDDFTQLELLAAVTFHLAVEIEEITVAYFWTKTKKLASKKILRADCADIWAAILPRVQRYQAAHDAQDFPPRPGDHCRWCQVTTCQYWQAKK